MSFLVPTVNRPDAQRVLAPTRWTDRLRRWIGRHAPRRSHLEVLWLPRYHLTFEVHMAQRPEGRESLDVLVDAYSGELSAYPPDAPMSRSGDVECFAPTITVGEAESQARRQFGTAALQSGGWGRRAELGSLCTAEVVHYPMWVYYFERRAGRLDCRLLDARSGKRVGAKAREALLAALGQGQNGGGGGGGR